MNNKYSMVVGGLILSSFAVGGTYINNSIEIIETEVVEAKTGNVVETQTGEEVTTDVENVEQTNEESVVETTETTETTEVTDETVTTDETTETTTETNTEDTHGPEEVKPYTATETLSTAVEDYKAHMPVEIEYVKRSDYQGQVPNEMNEIIIAMYHGINANASSSDQVHRSVEGFKQDLQTLYDNGYRAISMTDLMTNNIDVPAGYTPIVLTFDDGLSSQFSFVRDENGNLVPKNDTAVDIINEFNETHPGFGTNATFFVYSSQRPFKGEGTVDDAFDYLIANGYEIGSHTYSHPFLSNLNENEIQKELAYNTGYIAKHSRILTMDDVKYLAYPYGDVPNDSRNGVLLSGQYEDFRYNFDSGLIASPNFTNSSLMYSNDFDQYKVGRYRGTDNATYDLMYKVRQDEQNPENKFISDGNPDVVTVLEKDFNKVNLDTLDGKKLVVITE